MPSILDVFNSDAFSVVSLTAAINKAPFVPGRLGQMGLFEERGITSTTVVIEELNGTLSLIPTSPRGAPATQNQADKRTARSLLVPHIALEDTIMADELQNVRAFGSADQTQTIQQVVNDRLAAMARKHDATLEHLRVGAIKGQILDADGTTVLLDLFNAFGVTQHAQVSFAFSTAAVGDVRKTIHGIIRDIEDALGAATYDHVHAMCGSAFFDDLVAHQEVREAYARWIDNGQPGEFLRQRLARRAFPYAGVMFEEYRGKVGGNDFIPADLAYFFPVGAPDVFVTYFAPADFVETVNTVGLPRYAKQTVDREFGRWVKLHTQSNPLPLCQRPSVLIEATRL